MSTTQPAKEPAKRKGFAAMDKEKQREIASKGGKRAHANGNAHRFTPEKAAEAGRVAHAMGNAHQWTSEEAAEAGRKGARVRVERARAAAQQKKEPDA